MSKVIKFVDTEIDGIDYADYPDFVDAFICSAIAVHEDGTTREASEDEIEELNNDYDLLYKHIMMRLF